MEDIESIIENACTGNVYARCLPSDCIFDEEKFINSKSFDEFVIEEPKSMEEAKELVDKYDLPGEAIKLEAPGCFGGFYGVLYDGVNALQEYDENLQSHGTIVIFEGEYLGGNLFKDGDVVKPEKIIKVIEM